jgi:aryl-alcohol dehydrogenase-like predicted oxidoreductase
VYIATKFGRPVDERRKGAKPAYVRSALEDSLRRLRTDYVDLYQLPQPDPDVPIADTLGALEDLVRAGKVRVSRQAVRLETAFSRPRTSPRSNSWPRLPKPAATRSSTWPSRGC